MSGVFEISESNADSEATISVPNVSGTSLQGPGMATWARRMHRRAATIGNVVTSCGHSNPSSYPRRIEKVKFGVPLDQVCKNDIPAPLLVLILKLNKEAPYKKDIFRAPGHQANMKKLIHFMQNGRLVNIDNFSVYTIASVLKKFLRKIPDGIFGADREERLFQIIECSEEQQGDEVQKYQRDEIQKLVTSMPVYVQHMLVLLFGTLRVIATNAERAQTGMSSEALGVSVAPSFFHSCVSDGKQAKMEDVIRFKIATRVMKFLIDNFGACNLFGRENYEYYARITGRVLKVENELIFSFHCPPDRTMSREDILEVKSSWHQREPECWGLSFNLQAISTQEESHSTPALIHMPEICEESSDVWSGNGQGPGPSAAGPSRVHVHGNHRLRESCTRLSVSLEEAGLFKGTTTSSSSSSSASSHSHHLTLEELKAINRYAESTKSLSYLPLVHERQTARMRTRSEWFLSEAPMTTRILVVPIEFEDGNKVFRAEGGNHRSIAMGVEGVESLKMPVRRTSSKEKKLLRRSSSKSKKDKENGSKAVSVEALYYEKAGSPRRGSAPGSSVHAVQTSPSRAQSVKNVPTEVESEVGATIPSHSQSQHHTSLAYKPRI